MAFITTLLFRGTMRLYEILDAPLPLLNAIHENLLAEYCKNLGVAHPDAAEDYPEEISREEYFAMLNKQSG